MKSLYPKDHLCCYCGREADDYLLENNEVILVCNEHLEVLQEERNHVFKEDYERTQNHRRRN